MIMSAIIIISPIIVIQYNHVHIMIYFFHLCITNCLINTKGL